MYITEKYFVFLFALFLMQNGYSQTTISGTLQSIPSKTIPTEARVTLKNIATGDKHSQRTKDGTYSISGVPNGTFEERVEVPGNYVIIDTLNITSNKILNEKLMKDKLLTSQIYLDWGEDLLFLFKDLTSTYDGAPGGTTLARARDSPLRIDARNYNPTDPLSMPQGVRPYLDTILTDLSSKLGFTMFTEENIGDVRVQFQYPPNAQMPQPVFGWTIFGYDLTNIWLNRDLLNYYITNNQPWKNNGIFARELYRAMHLQTNSVDPAMVSYYDGPTINAARFHPDEIEVIKRVFTLDNGTNMKKYRDLVVASISNILPQIITFSNPINNSTVIYDANGNLVVNHNAIGHRDGDGEAQRVVVRFRGNGLDQYFTDFTPDGTILVPKTIFQPSKQYTLEGMTISGFDTIPAANIITFTTPLETSLEEFDHNTTHFYPNPVKDFLKIKGLFDTSENFMVSIYNLNGILVDQFEIDKVNSEEISLDLSSFDSGTYFIKITSGKSIKTFKIIKI